MHFTSSALNVNLRMRWVMFLIYGGEVSWHGKFRQAHLIFHLSPQRADTVGNGSRTFPKYPTTSCCLWVRKANQKGRKGDSVSLTRSTQSPTSSYESICHTRCLLVPKSFAYFQPCSLQATHWGEGNLTVCSSHGLLFAWSLDPGSAGSSCLGRLWLLV